MSKINKLLVDTAYFPNIEIFALIKNSEQVIFEQFENYQKQSFRNRCSILSANGVLNLTIPVAKEASPKVLIKNIRIAYDMPWQRQHLRAIHAAYKSSPFYDFYIDDIKPFFERHFDFLFDFNTKIIYEICQLIGIETNFSLTSEYKHFGENEIVDAREWFHPKKENPQKIFTENYRQVFDNKFGFTENLSILDLLFNEGPNSIKILSTKKP